MRQEQKYRKRLTDLERDSRVPRADQVEMVEKDEPRPLDPRGEQPDRDWFAAGG